MYPVGCFFDADLLSHSFCVLESSIEKGAGAAATSMLFLMPYTHARCHKQLEDVESFMTLTC